MSKLKEYVGNNLLQSILRYNHDGSQLIKQEEVYFKIKWFKLS